MTREKLVKAVHEARANLRRDRMVSIRLSEDEYTRLFAVADRQGVPAATLARVLVVEGVADLEAEPWDEEG